MFKKMMIALATLSLSSAAIAADAPRILYMEVDQGPQLMERDHPAFTRLFDHTGNYLHHEKIRLFEEDQRHEAGRRSIDEALDIAQGAKGKRLDAVVLVSLKHIQKKDGPKAKDRMVAIAKIFDARTLDIVDSVRVKSPTASLRTRGCHKECRQLVMRRHVREVLPSFKQKLAERLQDYRPAKRHVKGKSLKQLTLTLKGFKPREIRHIEDRIVRLSSTRDLSSLTSKPAKPAFWLERRKGAGDVRKDLNKVLADLDLQARIIQTRSQVTLVKIHQDLAYLD
ncbi:exported hypothetical protein [Candidatus Terasakiella magnetica]|uniref:Uncharacterized protein n=1 Tax=Candidatus Terasakiella magnetica TaxID=1867952 RepID=A0A1C3RLU7_9PROT|nr:hypothetical protein [Candidatus Terasakiella magnetica]SCA58271.1 exported hypothetical protein [Candidatus Terasakiella magnetica]